jgi:hypothetical protein
VVISRCSPATWRGGCSFGSDLDLLDDGWRRTGIPGACDAATAKHYPGRDVEFIPGTEFTINLPADQVEREICARSSTRSMLVWRSS